MEPVAVVKTRKLGCQVYAHFETCSKKRGKITNLPKKEKEVQWQKVHTHSMPPGSGAFMQIIK